MYLECIAESLICYYVSSQQQRLRGMKMGSFQNVIKKSLLAYFDLSLSNHASVLNLAYIIDGGPSTFREKTSTLNLCQSFTGETDAWPTKCCVILSQWFGQLTSMLLHIVITVNCWGLVFSSLLFLHPNPEENSGGWSFCSTSLNYSFITGCVKTYLILLGFSDGTEYAFVMSLLDFSLYNYCLCDFFPLQRALK